MGFRSVNPTNGREVRVVPFASKSEHAEILGACAAASAAWQNTEIDLRAALLRRLAHLIRERASPLAMLMAEEMGKPVREGRAECEKCAGLAEYYAEHGRAFLAPDDSLIPGVARVQLEPLGTVLLVMPWNFPFWQVFRCAVPALLAGNTVLLKHAPNVPGCALALSQLFLDSGFPKATFANVFAPTESVESLISSDSIDAVSLTGSTRAGRVVATAAGRALKKAVLELGGSDAYLILADADLDLAVEACATGRLINGGQSCIAAKRFIAVDPVHDEFLARFTQRMLAVSYGDPTEDTTLLGPLAREDLRDTLQAQVDQSVRLGARLSAGGSIPEGPGFFYPPTVLADVAPGMPVFDEETFGPVAAVVRARDAQHAIELANQSRFGLGSAIFTRDADAAKWAAAEMKVGCVFVNGFVRSDARLPFGGIRDSGYGRELSRYGLLEFVNIKTVYSVRKLP